MVPIEHSVDPHWQSALLAVIPFSSWQYGIALHVLLDASQNNPDDAIQFELPHSQSIPTVFDVIPVVLAQVVEGRNEQELEEATQ